MSPKVPEKIIYLLQIDRVLPPPREARIYKLRPSFGPSRVIKHGKQKPPRKRGADSKCFPNRPGISETAFAGASSLVATIAHSAYRQPTVPYLKVTCHKAEEQETKILISRVCSR